MEGPRKHTPATFELKAIAIRLEHERRSGHELVPIAYVEELRRAAEASETTVGKQREILQGLLDAWVACVGCGAPATQEREGGDARYCDGCAPLGTSDIPGAMAVRAAQFLLR